MTDPTPTIHPAAHARRGLTDATHAILERRLYAVLATQNDDGNPHPSPVMLLFANERIVIETGAATRKARNVAARPHASVLVQMPEPPGSAALGRATIIHRPRGGGSP